MAKRKKNKTQEPLKMSAMDERLLLHAAYLSEEGELEQAVDLLYDLAERNPNSLDVYLLLSEILTELENLVELVPVSRELIRLKPGEPFFRYINGVARINNGELGGGLFGLRLIQKRWPKFEHIADIDNILESVFQKFQDENPMVKISLDEMISVCQLEDEVLKAISRGEFDEARERLEELFRLAPLYQAGLVHWAHIAKLRGEHKRALSTSEQVLALNPQQAEMLSLQAEVHFLDSNLKAAGEALARLRAIDDRDQNKWFPLTYSLVIQGDWPALTALHAEILQLPPDVRQAIHPDVFHHIAFAFTVQGNHSQARQEWQKILKRVPDHLPSLENLEIMKKPKKERKGFFALDADLLLGAEVLYAIQAGIIDEDDQAVRLPFTRTLLKENPRIKKIAPVVYEAGDQLARLSMMAVSVNAGDRELGERLTDFLKSGQLSSELETILVNQIMAKKQKPAAKPARQTSRQEENLQPERLKLNNYRINYGQQKTFNKQVEALAEQGYELMAKGDFAQAQKVFEKALQHAPDDLTLQNNLAVTLGRQGREDEAEARILQIHADHPEYMTAGFTVIYMHIKAGEMEKARELLTYYEDLRSELHISEMAGLCKAEITYWMEMKNPEQAGQWYRILSELLPKDETVRKYRAVFEAVDVLRTSVSARKKKSTKRRK